MAGVGSLLFMVPHFTTDTYIPTEEVIDGNVCSMRNGTFMIFSHFYLVAEIAMTYNIAVLVVVILVQCKKLERLISFVLLT